MPKKTKKEKIIAAYRKRLKLLEIQSTSPVLTKPQIHINKQIKTLEQPKKTPEEQKNPIVENKNELLIFKSDFKKSLILSAAIIALEILFYFATINKYLKLI